VKKALKWGGIVLLLVVCGLAIFVATFTPAQRETTDLKVESTPDRIAHGKYLFNHAFACVSCHTDPDLDRYGFPPKGEPGAGGFCFPESLGMPGTICVPNLTPARSGLADWTDDEILRAIREGVDKDGEALFPMMPYPDFKDMSDEDAHSLVAYMRSMNPVETENPSTSIDFPVSFFIKMAPQPLTEKVPEPNRGDPLEYGKYLATMGGCKTCHTPVDDKHQSIEGKEFAGGQEFKLPSGSVFTPNLTSHETGKLPANADAFVNLFRSFQDMEAIAKPIKKGEKNTPMPWYDYANMTDEDLKAIYTYLKSVPVQDNKVEIFPGG